MSNHEKMVLTGNQGIARGFYEAGGLLAASYPGSPTVEILDSIKDYEEVYAEFSTSEKVAFEVAIGGSFAGVRSMASMKHVGVNIAADPLMSFTQTKTNGGFVLLTGEDPGMASSQNEQDNRILGKFANMGIVAPGDSQEAIDYTKAAFDLSEEYHLPMMVNITSRVCHSRTPVVLGERKEVEPRVFEKDVERYCMIPPHTHPLQHSMKDRIDKLKEFAYDSELNTFEEGEDKDTLIVTSGLLYHNLKELDLNLSIYKLGMVYPLSPKRLQELSQKFKRIIVIEELMPVIETEIKMMGIECEGKKYFSFTGELHTEDIEEGLKKAGVITERTTTDRAPVDSVKRTPLFCAGCPHRPIFDILKKLRKRVIGDIGCYSMAMFEPFQASDSIISMGATVGITKGMTKANALTGKSEPLVSVIGDGTMFHSGLPGFVNLLHQENETDNMTFIVLDNRTTAMTGGQATAASGNYTSADDMHVDIKTFIQAIGHENVVEVDQFDYEATKKVITEETNKPGISFIIAKRPCALKFKIQENTFYVNPNVCIGCRNCIKTNCPPIRMKKYHNIDKLKSSIDPSMCAGCSVCAQVCPVDAIQPKGQHPDHSKKGSAKYKRQEYQKMKLNNEDQNEDPK
ncbi:thiamine pyrophosphate-dependent enzyme [Isachenkonia alkalipeptolytica]|uniref:Indolepyruvate oxidoreductase subunit IorA n=1 Tax=Isachenkonia alkalipeptolytica TaxID=2565777 RepID=A0AA43XKG6_9CLOT|nr:indolepyruvate ferredoxin oxidoreductase subunit alpha [Isachenkonia alkalipeptolytica]NBG87964.1 indolepyruvate ferredoxin oxidoreductase subunit alpha [Isachenkonia alkalipeptolytica]